MNDRDCEPNCRRGRHAVVAESLPLRSVNHSRNAGRPALSGGGGTDGRQPSVTDRDRRIGSRNPSAASLWACLVLLLALPALVSAEEPEVIVEIERDEMIEGESVLYRVTLNHVENPSPPELRGFDDFIVVPQGERSLNSRSITIVNGQRSEVVRNGRQYDYRLTPRRPGQLTVPAPVANIDGREIVGRAISLKVKESEEQDIAILEVTTDRDTVYPMQPFRVTLTVAVRGLSGRYADQNPVTVQSPPPALMIPWVDDGELPDGLQTDESWSNWLGALRDRRGGGFRINNVGDNSVFTFFDSVTSFQPRPRRTRRKTLSGEEAEYWEYDFTREFTSRAVGDYNFGPVTLKGTFATRVNGQGRAVGEQIFVVARGVTVHVKPVPTDGRPDSYNGGIGKFQVKSALAPTHARVGDPLTLTVTLTGKGTLDDTDAPDLQRIPEIADQFKIYEATAETKATNERRFTYSLRALDADIDSFPAIPISYFDVERERYVNIQTEPIPLQIDEADRLSDTEIVSTDAVSGRGDSTLTARNEGVFANIGDIAQVHDDAVHPARWLWTWVGMLGSYVGVIVLTGMIQRRNSDPLVVRRRAAPHAARSELQQARTDINAGRDRDGLDHLRAAFAMVIAAVTDQPEAGLTARDAREQLVHVGVDTEVADRVHDLLVQCDDARYGAATGQSVELRGHAEQLLHDLIHSLKLKKLVP